MQKLHAYLRTPRQSEAAVRVKEFFRDVKDAIMPDFMVLQPAYAWAQNGYARPVPPIKVSWPEPAKPTIMHFDTGPAPVKGSASRTIIDWGQVDILLPGETPAVQGKKYIDYLQAQKEVSNLLKDKASSHQYLSYEAAKLLGSNPRVQRYTLHLVAGALAEDYVFAPGENLETITLKESKRRAPRTREEMSDVMGYEDVPSAVPGIFSIFSKIYKFFSGGGEKDSVNRPYFAHFCQVLTDGTRRGLEMAGGDLKFQSARTRIMGYWDLAAKYYAQGDKPKAFCALGHMIHLVQDVHMPTHVHNDPHPSGDSLEEWYTHTDYPHIARKPDEPNIRIWNSKGIRPPEPDASWTKDNISEKLGAFIDKIAINSQLYRSVDHEGTAKDQKKTGRLSNQECYDQAEHLIPLAIYKSAWIVSQFLDYHKRVYNIG